MRNASVRCLRKRPRKEMPCSTVNYARADVAPISKNQSSIKFVQAGRNMRYEIGEHWLLGDSSVIEILTSIMWCCHSLDKFTIAAGNMVAYNAHGVVNPHFWPIAAAAANIH